MSIKDYNKHYIVLNGVTNEQIKVIKTDDFNTYVDVQMSINDYFLWRTIERELHDCDTVTVLTMYMKD